MSDTNANEFVWIHAHELAGRQNTWNTFTMIFISTHRSQQFESWSSQTIILEAMMGLRSKMPSSFASPFLYSAAVTRQHLNTSRETCSGLMMTSLADDYDRQQLISWFCVTHDSVQLTIVHSVPPHLECGTIWLLTSPPHHLSPFSNSVWRPFCSHSRSTSDKLLDLLLPVLEA